MQKEVVEDTRLWPGVWFIFCCLLLLGIIFPYLNSIILTKLYTDQEPAFAQICITRGQDFKKVQILDYQPQYSKAQIDCLYHDSGQNLRIRLFKDKNEWEVNTSHILNKPRNFYWPIFL